jgi:hypothetical protein
VRYKHLWFHGNGYFQSNGNKRVYRMEDFKVRCEVWFTYPGLGYHKGKKYIKVTALTNHFLYCTDYRIPVFKDLTSEDSAAEEVYKSIKEMIELYVELRDFNRRFYWFLWIRRKMRFFLKNIKNVFCKVKRTVKC